LLQHPTIDRLREFGLEGMAKSLRDLDCCATIWMRERVNQGENL
jgi:hypothetical protein